jgi:hypothetical protein
MRSVKPRVSLLFILADNAALDVAGVDARHGAIKRFNSCHNQLAIAPASRPIHPAYGARFRMTSANAAEFDRAFPSNNTCPASSTVTLVIPIGKLELHVPQDRAGGSRSNSLNATSAGSRCFWRCWPRWEPALAKAR